jgi:8-oxo-dGTP pyrophosphatase MutT (NUDIX family)
MKMIRRRDILSCLDPIRTSHLERFAQVHGSGRLASVLVIIHYSYGIPYILFTKRSSSLASHGGEISFPGGKFVKDDKALYFTALRETKEEVGLDFKKKDICGSLEAVRTVTSNYIITPYLTVQGSIPKPTILQDEVQKILDVPLLDVLNTVTPDKERGKLPSKDRFKFIYNREVIWGATARILKQLYDRLFARYN